MVASFTNICTFLSEHHVCQMSGVGLVLVSDDAHHDGVKIAHNIELLQYLFVTGLLYTPSVSHNTTPECWKCFAGLRFVCHTAILWALCKIKSKNERKSHIHSSLIKHKTWPIPYKLAVMWQAYSIRQMGHYDILNLIGQYCDTFGSII